MTARDAQFDGKRILFWKDEGLAWPAGWGWIGEMLGAGGVEPRDSVRHDIPWEDREVVIKALQLRSTMNPTGGEVLMGYMGWADCRICKEKLGTRDLFGYGFVWPEKADHYIAVHKVWTRDCDALLAAVRQGRKR